MTTQINLREYAGDDIAPILALPGVLPASEAPTDGTYVVVVVDWGAHAKHLEETSNVVGLGHIHDTARYDITFGFNNAADTLEPAEDCWNTVGWCWSHDHHTDGSPRVVAYLPDAKLQDVHRGCGLMGY